MPGGKRALQKEYIDEKVVQLHDHLFERVTSDAEFVDELMARLQPQLDAFNKRLERIEQAIDTGDDAPPIGHVVQMMGQMMTRGAAPTQRKMRTEK